MRIYRISPDLNYRMLFPATGEYSNDRVEFKGIMLSDRWRQYPVKLDDDDSPVPNFAYFDMSTFAVDIDTADELADILEPCAELLPVQDTSGRLWYLINVTNTYEDALNADKSKFMVDERGHILMLEKPVFIKERLGEKSIFKISQDNYSTIYVIDRQDSDHTILKNFFAAYHYHQFSGIEFELLQEV